MNLSLRGGSVIVPSTTAARRRERLCAALLRISRAALRAATREGLCGEVCRAAVTSGGFLFAWIGWRDADGLVIVPAAHYGAEDESLEVLNILTDERAEAQGPADVAFRTLKPFVCNDFLRGSPSSPWRGAAERAGIAACAAFPLRLQGVVSGALTVYASEVGYFDCTEFALLQEAAADISYAMDVLTRDQEGRSANDTSKLELSEAQSQFEAVVDNLDDGLLIYDMQGKFLRSNVAARKILALSESSAMPADLDESFVSYEMSTLMGTVLTKEERPVARLIRGEQLRDFEARARRLDSPWQRIISYSGTTVRDARGKMSAFLTLRDITARKEAQEALRLSEQRLRDAQRIAKMGSWDLDAGTGLLVGSEQLFEIFSIPKEEVGAGVDSFLRRVHPSDRERVDEARCALVAGDAPLDIEFRIVIPQGTVKWVHAIGEMSRGAHGPRLQFGGTVVDITSRQQAAERLLEANARLEERVGERTRELAIARDLAESADRLKSAFLATMSHELRTPLNSILGFTSIVLRGMAGPLTVEQSKQLGMVQSSARHLLSLINDVLDISKIEAGQLEIHAKAIDVRALVENVIETISPMADKKGLPLRVSAAEGAILVSDQRRVEQVLLNLLANAVKFTEQGDIELAVTFSSDYQITGATAGQRCVRFRVTDTGAGIKDGDLSTLFKPFQQIDSGLTRHHEGSGLGLAICRRLADLLGGEILVESRFGIGSTFIFTIPQRPSRGP